MQANNIEAESAQDYFVLPIWYSNTSTVKSSKAKNTGEEPNKNPDLKTDEKPIDKEDQVFLDGLEKLKRQEHDANDAAKALRKEFAKDTKDLLLQAGAAKASSTNIVNTASTPVSTASPYGGLSFTNTDQDDFEIHALEDMYDHPTDSGSSFDLEAYSDSNYAGANLDRKSTTGGCQFLGRRLISWQYKKQTILATSTIEAEYVAALSYAKAPFTMLSLIPVDSTKILNSLECQQIPIINNVRYITAKVAGKPVSISEASIRSDLLFEC
ncbi:hypothetical protein Tco_1482572 [Tanacetum coccineum]